MSVSACEGAGDVCALLGGILSRWETVSEGEACEVEGGGGDAAGGGEG